jgi:hypothetical protein
MKITPVKTMKKPIKATLPLCMAAAFALLSCTGAGTRPSEKDMNQIVMRAFLFAGQPVKNVLLMNLAKTVHDSVMKTIRYTDNTFNQTDTIDTVIQWLTSSTIDNALVTISCNGVSQELTFSDSGQYEDKSGNLIIASGQTYRIDVIADGRHAWAETTVPSNSGLSVSRDTIYADTTDENTSDSCDGYGVCPKGAKMPGEVADGASPQAFSDRVTNLTFKWSNPDRRYFYYRCYLDQNLPGLLRGWADQYTDRDSLTVTTVLGKEQYGFPPQIVLFRFDSTGLILPEPGKYKMVIYSAPPEFGEVLSDINRADSTYQDQWTASPTNVNDGLGYFTAFCTDSISFTIVASGNDRSIP